MDASFLAYYLKHRFAAAERGASLVEYTLVLALVAVAAIVALQFIGDSSSDKLNSVGEKVCGTADADADGECEPAP